LAKYDCHPWLELKRGRASTGFDHSLANPSGDGLDARDALVRVVFVALHRHHPVPVVLREYVGHVALEKAEAASVSTTELRGHERESA
jgi:hypothetical protein